MNTKSLLKAAAVALSILTISGIPSGPLTSTASAGVLIDDDGVQDEKAVKIIEASLEKLGGREKLSEIKSMKQSGTISIPMAGLSGTIELNITTPDRMLLKVDLPAMGTTLQGLNGETVWSTDPMNGPRLIPDTEAKEIIQQADLSYSLNFLDHNPTIEYIGEVEFDGSKAHKIRLVNTQGDESFDYYSVETGLQTGSDTESDTPMGRITISTYLRDYKDFDGYLQAGTMVQMIGQTEIKTVFDTIEYNKVDDTVYVIPAAVNALIEATKAKTEAAP
jgi:hypothetical protein